MADATMTLDGGASGRLDAISDEALYIAFVTIAAGATYATGGNPVVLPAGLDGWLLRDLSLIQRHDGTRVWEFDRTNVKLKAYDAFATEEGNGADTSATSLRAMAILTR